MARRRNKEADPDEVLAVITPRTSRRVVAVGMIGILGALLWVIAAARPPEVFGWMLFLVFLGAGCLWLAVTMWPVTGRPVELTRPALPAVGGRLLCRAAGVDPVDRGLFAFKPAGGFLIRLKAPLGRVIAPGLWWRVGRTLAVGGATARRDAKEVADLMTVLILERDGDL